MDILLLTLGTRGDVQPFVALGQGLQRAGHEVTVCTSSSFASFVQENGLRYAYLNNDVVDLATNQVGRKIMEEAGSLWGFMKWYVKAAKQVKPIYRRALREEWEAAQGAEAVIYHPKAVGGFHIAEALKIPGFMVALLPAFVPTSAFPNPILPRLSLGGWYNRFTYRVVPALTNLSLGSVVNRWREEVLDLPKRSRFRGELERSDGQSVPVLHAISPEIIPPPSDWPASAHMTGYWFLDRKESWQPPDELTAFLETGDPPIVVTFGSISGQDPARSAEIVIEALRKTGERGILVTGWGGLEATDLPNSVLQIRAAPYEWLFPRSSAVVHHGGAGTTAAGLRAGKPSIVCPFFGDQPFWGHRIEELGVGPPPLPQRDLNAVTLSSAIERAVDNGEMQRKATQIGAKIRNENGVDAAARLIERYVDETA